MMRFKIKKWTEQKSPLWCAPGHQLKYQMKRVLKREKEIKKREKRNTKIYLRNVSQI